MTRKVDQATRILYVEDEEDIREVVSQMLNLLGYEVSCAENGKLGVEKAASWKPDIILMDVRMPVMSGPEAIRILRSRPETSQIPIFVLTAHTDTKTLATCEEAGADGSFAKPPDFGRIDLTIQETMNRSTYVGSSGSYGGSAC